jgi:hypothetical protein
MFTDGGGGHTVLDCADPDAPSVLKDCFRENIGGPDWGKPICELGQWIVNGTRWMQLGTCRFEPDRKSWWPGDAACAYWPDFDLEREPDPPL